MQIVEPHLSGPAGDLSAIGWSADDDPASVTWNTPASRPATTPHPQPVNSAPPITQLLTGPSRGSRLRRSWVTVERGSRLFHARERRSWIARIRTLVTGLSWLDALDGPRRPAGVLGFLQGPLRRRNHELSFGKRSIRASTAIVSASAELASSSQSRPRAASAPDGTSV